MARDIDLLKANLEEIYVAAYAGKVSPSDFVAWGDRLYLYRGSWFGRIIAWIQKIFYKPGYISSRVEAALKKTESIFQSEIEHFQIQAKKIETALSHWAEGSLEDTYAVDAQLDYFERFNHAARPFIKLCKSAHSDKIQTLFGKNSPFFQKQLDAVCHTGKYLHHLKYLFGISHGDLPIHTLKKSGALIVKTVQHPVDKPSESSNYEVEKEGDKTVVIEKVPLDAEDIKILKKWVWRIKTKQLNIRDFDNSLKALEILLNKHHKSLHSSQMGIYASYRFRASKMHYMLHAHCNLNVILEADPKHMAWRNNLKKGTVINDGSTSIKLGEPVGDQNDFHDKDIILTIQGSPSIYFAVTINRALLGMRNYRRAFESETFYSLKPQKFSQIDSTGRSAKIEKLFPPHANADFTAGDEVFANFIAWSCEQQFTSDRLELRYIRRSLSGELVHTREFQPHPFDFNKIEKFCIDLAKDGQGRHHYSLYRYYVDKLPHSITKYVNFYYYCQLRGLENYIQRHVSPPFHVDQNKLWNEMDVSALAKKLEIKETGIINQGEALCEEAKKIIPACLAELKKKREAPPNIATLITEVFVQQFYQYQTIGRFWPHLKEIVVSEVSKRVPSTSN